MVGGSGVKNNQPDDEVEIGNIPIADVGGAKKKKQTLKDGSRKGSTALRSQPGDEEAPGGSFMLTQL